MYLYHDRDLPFNRKRLKRLAFFHFCFFIYLTTIKDSYKAKNKLFCIEIKQLKPKTQCDCMTKQAHLPLPPYRIVQSAGICGFRRQPN